MKGISAVIATILLLLIVIAIVGFAFGFFQRIFTTTSTAAETQTNTAITNTQTVARIDNAAGTAIAVRNSGTTTIDTSQIAFYANGAARTCTLWSSPTILQNAVATCTLSASCTGQTLRITIGNSEDSRSCA